MTKRVTPDCRLPFSAWLGLGIVMISEAGMLAQIEPFWSWHTPIAWTGYIFFIDGIIWRSAGTRRSGTIAPRWSSWPSSACRCGSSSRIITSTALQTGTTSACRHVLLVRYVGYFWAFATIWPAILITAELVGASARPSRAGLPRRRAASRPARSRGLAQHRDRRGRCWSGRSCIRRHGSPRRSGSASSSCSIRSTPRSAPSRCAAIC